MVTSQNIRGQFLHYAIVGSLGFAIDGGFLYFLIWHGADPFYARAVSFPIAVSITWYINRVWTFKAQKLSTVGRQYLSYFAVQIAGALANYICYVVILMQMEPTANNAIVALAAGATIGLFISYSGAKRIVFNQSNADRHSEGFL